MKSKIKIVVIDSGMGKENAVLDIIYAPY